MRSILTLEGAGAPPKPRRRKPLAAPQTFGTCKPVTNPRTKKTLQLCYVGKTWNNKTVPTGWRLMSKDDLARMNAELKRK